MIGVKLKYEIECLDCSCKFLAGQLLPASVIMGAYVDLGIRQLCKEEKYNYAGSMWRFCFDDIKKPVLLADRRFFRVTFFNDAPGINPVTVVN